MHLIEQNTDFATRGQIAWHRLGTVFPKQQKLTGKEMGEMSNTWFDVQKVENLIEKPISLNDFLRDKEISEDNIVNILKEYEKARFYETGSYSTVRSDNREVLGSVGEGYEVFQNKEMYTFLEQFRGDNNYVRYETAGCLSGGKTVFVTAKIPEKLIVHKDVVDQYLVITNSHDGSGTLKILWTPIRVVCNNTLSMALSSRKGTIITPKSTGHFRTNFVSIKHTANMRSAVDRAHSFLGLVSQSQAIIQGQVELLYNTRLSDKDFDKWLVELFVESTDIKKDIRKGAKLQEVVSPRMYNKLNQYKEFYHGAAGQQKIVGTAWGGYNAVTYGITHGTLWRKDEQDNAEQSFKHSFTGTQQTARMSKAWNLALEHCLN